MGIGDWGLGIGPIPNPQSPIPTPPLSLAILINKFILIIRIFNKLKIILIKIS
jgi:hypothetical protein